MLQDWLQTPSSEWPQHSHYRIINMFVKEMPTSNDIAERGEYAKVRCHYLCFPGCHLITEFCNRVQSNQARSDLLQVVALHRESVKGFTKKDLSLC